MAKRRTTKYRMTPKRRAALKRAQMLSARKRRRARVKNGLKAAAVIGVAVGTQAATHWTNYAIHHPGKTYQGAKKAGAYVKSRFNKTGNLKPPAIAPKQPSNWKRSPGGGYLYHG